LNLDNSNVTGSVSFPTRSLNNLQFTLNLDQLDTNLYQPATNPQATGRPLANATTSVTATQPPLIGLPISVIKQLTANGTVAIGSLRYGPLVMDHFTSQVTAGNGTLKLNPIQANLYRGSYSGQLAVDASQPQPKYALNGSLHNVDIQPLLQALSAITKIQMTGITNMTLQLTSQGLTPEAVVQGLNGQLVVALKNGVWQDLDLAYYFNLGKALLSNQETGQLVNTGKTTLGNLTGTFTIQQGIATNKDLLLSGPTLQATGEGKIDLVQQQVDYTLNLHSTNDTNFVVPIRFIGPFNHVSVQPDVQAVLNNQLKSKAKQLGNQLNPQLQEAIKQLFH
jgi:AsmA protein